MQGEATVTRNFGNDDRIADLISRGHLIYLGNYSQWGSSFSNGAAAIQQPSQIGVDTNITQNASGIIYAYLNGLKLGGTNSERVDWDKKLWVRFGLWCRDIAGADHADSIYRVQIKEAVSEGALAAKGIGIRIDGATAFVTNIIAESYGSSLAATDTTVDVVSYQSNWIDIIHYPGEKIEWYIDGVLKRTETTAAKIPSGTAGASTAFTISAINGTSTGDGRIQVHNIFIWQEA